jgi:hypothetical protein
LIVSTAIAAAMAVSASALPICAADQSDTASIQMACCKAMQADCPRTSASMACCKVVPRPQQQNVAKAPAPPISPRPEFAVSTSVALALAVRPISRTSRPPLALFAGISSPPRFAYSSLVI